MIKLVFCLRRKPGMTREEFQRYWREQHASLVADRQHQASIEVAADGTLEVIQKLSGNGDVVSGLPAGHYTDLAVDPGMAGDIHYYAASPNTGVHQFTPVLGLAA